MPTDQKFQMEGIRERAGEAIFPRRIRGESSISRGDYGVYLT